MRKKLLAKSQQACERHHKLVNAYLVRLRRLGEMLRPKARNYHTQPRLSKRLRQQTLANLLRIIDAHRTTFRTAGYLINSYRTVSDNEILYSILRLLARSLVMSQELHDLVSKLILTLATSARAAQTLFSQLKGSFIVLLKEVK